MELKTPLVALSGIGPSLAERLNRLELFTVEDLIYHFPFRYDDFSAIKPLDQTRIGETATFRGELWSIKNTYTRFRKVLTQAILNDGTSPIDIVWFNQPWLTKNLHPGDQIQVSGKLQRKGSKISLVSPVWEKISNPVILGSTSTSLSATPESDPGQARMTSGIGENDSIHTGRLVPVYPETYGLTSKWLRLKISQILPLISPKITDPLPESIRDNMLPLQKSLQQIHFPDNFEQVRKATERLAFDELFFVQLQTQKKRAEWKEKKVVTPWKIDRKKLDKFLKSLPFTLTSAQQKVLEEIISDLERNQPMNRLMQGEVGSGKTVVAAAIAYLASLANLRTVLMAPTEILAFQHFETLSKFLGPLGIEVGIYTGSKKRVNSVILNPKGEGSLANAGMTETSSEILRSAQNDKGVIVGTHALLSTKLNLDNVGLVIVDEQQRFGVEQRSFLRSRAKTPHFLTMTATPIPRTVALTLYGDLDLSVIDQIPVGRKVVRTHFVPHRKRTDAYKFIARLVEQGQQVYIITPLIEESETNFSAKAAKVEFEKLKDIFPKFKLGLLHGRLKSKEKEEVINNFKDHTIDLLVSTSVVEVGMDIPNATVMVIEGAERFGLAQLHQLRGRVGRGELQSYTFLFAEEENPQVVSRLKNLEKIRDGLKLAELDLKIRGSGEIFGKQQSGRWNLKIADLSDLPLIEKTREAAKNILEASPNLDKYPELKAKLSGLEKEIMPD